VQFLVNAPNICRLVPNRERKSGIFKTVLPRQRLVSDRDQPFQSFAATETNESSVLRRKRPFWPKNRWIRVVSCPDAILGCVN